MGYFRCGLRLYVRDEILTALAIIITRSKGRKPFSENCYLRVVRPEGSPIGRKLIEETMEPL